MKFKIDENLPAELKSDLLAVGRDAELVVDEGLQGSPDPPVLLAAQQEGHHWGHRGPAPTSP